MTAMGMRRLGRTGIVADPRTPGTALTGETIIAAMTGGETATEMTAGGTVTMTIGEGGTGIRTKIAVAGATKDAMRTVMQTGGMRRDGATTRWNGADWRLVITTLMSCTSTC